MPSYFIGRIGPWYRPEPGSTPGVGTILWAVAATEDGAVLNTALSGSESQTTHHPNGPLTRSADVARLEPADSGFESQAAHQRADFVQRKYPAPPRQRHGSDPRSLPQLNSGYCNSRRHM